MRKRRNTVVGLIVVAVVGGGLLLGNGYGESKTNPIPELVLPVEGQAVDEFNPTVDLVSAPPSGDVMVYKFKNKEINEQDAKALADKIGVEGNIRKDILNRTMIIENDAEFFQVEYETGKADYFNWKEIHRKDLKNIPDDITAQKIAEDYLNNLGWLPKNFKFKAVTENREISGDLNPEVDKGIVTSKSVHFHQYMNDKPVLGVSRIVVQIGDDGVIESVNKYFKEVEEYGKYQIKSIDKAVEDLKQGKGIRVISDEHAEHAVIKKADILYWEDPDKLEEQPYLQPVYSMEGEYVVDGKKVPFSAYVPAIVEESTIPTQYEEIVSDPK